jgi:hypothetical protein
MADYVKLSLGLRASEMSDYVRPYLDPTQMVSELTPDENLWTLVDALTTGTTLSLANFTTLSVVVLQNTDTTNYVEAEWYYSRGSQAAPAAGWAFANDNPDTITDGDAGGTLVTNGAEVGGYVNVSASENSGENDGTYLVQAATTDVLTLGTGEALTANAADTTALLTLVRRNKDRIAPSSFLVLGPVFPDLNIVLTADTAACSVRAFGCGT